MKTRQPVTDLELLGVGLDMAEEDAEVGVARVSRRGCWCSHVAPAVLMQLALCQSGQQ